MMCPPMFCYILFPVTEANLATFCCHASSLSSNACWGAGRGGSPELQDASTGPVLQGSWRLSWEKEQTGTAVHRL